MANWCKSCKYYGESSLSYPCVVCERAYDRPPTKHEKSDYVKVVRCWECVHRRKRECPLYNEKYMEYDMGYGDIEQVCKITDGTIDDGFCYKGERRGD